jgi:hypothetical protein
MGIPVVFVASPQTLREDAYRLDPIRDLLPIYQAVDDIDWNPPVPDISVLSDRIRKQARELVPGG